MIRIGMFIAVLIVMSGCVGNKPRSCRVVKNALGSTWSLKYNRTLTMPDAGVESFEFTVGPYDTRALATSDARNMGCVL